MSRDVPGPARPDGAAARSLATLRSGESGIIVHIVATAPERLVKLSSLGVMPGAKVLLVQRHPAVVLRIGETSIAIDGEVAQDILVEPDAS